MNSGSIRHGLLSVSNNLTFRRSFVRNYVYYGALIFCRCLPIYGFLEESFLGRSLVFRACASRSRNEPLLMINLPI